MRILKSTDREIKLYRDRLNKGHRWITPEKFEQTQQSLLTRQKLHDEFKKLKQHVIEQKISKTINTSVDRMNQIGFEQFDLETRIDWDVNTKFINSSGAPGGALIDEFISDIGTIGPGKKHDHKDVSDKNLLKIQEWTGKQFDNIDEAQEYMLKEDIKRRHVKFKNDSCSSVEPLREPDFINDLFEICTKNQP